MSQLPQNPSLEHLKTQAKDLLKAYRAGEAEVSSRIAEQIKDFSASSRFLLADAQLVIAKEYGSPSWTKLKLHLEKMSARKPKMSARKTFIQELVNELLAWSKNLECEQLAQRFSIMPLRDILAVRDVVIKDNQHLMLVDGLLEGLKHSEPPVRYNCALALDHFADERCSEPLRRLLDDPVPRVRRAALHSLSCDACKVSPLPDRDDLTEKLIAMAMNDPSIRVRREAAYSLTQSCDEKTMPVLKTLLEDKDTAIQRTVRFALVRQQIL